MMNQKLNDLGTRSRFTQLGCRSRLRGEQEEASPSADRPVRRAQVSSSGVVGNRYHRLAGPRFHIGARHACNWQIGAGLLQKGRALSSRDLGFTQAFVEPADQGIKEVGDHASLAGVDLGRDGHAGEQREIFGQVAQRHLADGEPDLVEYCALG